MVDLIKTERQDGRFDQNISNACMKFSKKRERERITMFKYVL